MSRERDGTPAHEGLMRWRRRGQRLCSCETFGVYLGAHDAGASGLRARRGGGGGPHAVAGQWEMFAKQFLRECAEAVEIVSSLPGRFKQLTEVRQRAVRAATVCADTRSLKRRCLTRAIGVWWILQLLGVINVCLTRPWRRTAVCGLPLVTGRIVPDLGSWWVFPRVGGGGGGWSSSALGTTPQVLDCGGGTVDVACMEVCSRWVVCRGLVEDVAVRRLSDCVF